MLLFVFPSLPYLFSLKQRFARDSWMGSERYLIGITSTRGSCMTEEVAGVLTLQISVPSSRYLIKMKHSIPHSAMRPRSRLPPGSGYRQVTDRVMIVVPSLVFGSYDDTDSIQMPGITANSKSTGRRSLWWVAGCGYA
jgi:hypothetical protein